MSPSHCTPTLLGQLQHGLELALLVLAIGAIALVLDLFATFMAKAGASEETVGLIRFAGKWLLGIDVSFVLAFAAVQTSRALLCLA